MLVRVIKSYENFLHFHGQRRFLLEALSVVFRLLKVLLLKKKEKNILKLYNKFLDSYFREAKLFIKALSADYKFIGQKHTTHELF